MTADMLREAAAVLRERAGAATPGPWVTHELDNVFVGNQRDGRRHGLWEIVHMSSERLADLRPESADRDRGDATWIATMHPGVGLALADWLDYEARYQSGSSMALGYASVLARAILGRDA